MEGIQDFFFLMYIPNPMRERVRIYPDGEQVALYLSYNNFRRLLVEVGGYDIVPVINETLSTYGTPWLYIREKNNIVKVNASNDPGISVIELMKNTIAAIGKEDTDLLNPASKFAGAEVSAYELKDPMLPSPNTPKDGTKILPRLNFRR